jgi:hypothetical protein
VFVARDEGVVAALDLSSGRELATVEIGGEPDAIWCDPEHSRLYVSIGRPEIIDAIDTAVMARVERVGTEEGAHTSAFDRRRQRLYAFLPRSCRAAVYDAS